MNKVEKINERGTEMICEICDSLCYPIRSNDRSRYLETTRLLNGLIESNKYKMIDSTCSFDEVSSDKWFDDVITHIIQCNNCRRVFDLTANTYKGSFSFTRVK